MPPAPSPLDVGDLYRYTFAARLDAYADWLAVEGCSHEPCRCHWYTVRSELTPERIVEGLRARRPVSSYMEDSAGLTHVGAIDFDRPDGWELALAIAAKLRAAGAFPMMERSRRGGHLWLVLDRVIAGMTVRLGLRAFVQDVSEAAARDPKVEIMPLRMENRQPGSVGHALRLPMMSHQRTGQRWPLCDADGVPLGPTVIACVSAVELSPADALVRAAGRVKVPVAEAVVPASARRPALPAGDVVEALVNAGVERAAPGRTVRCPFHDDRVASLRVSPDGERVWCKSPECPAYNNGHGWGSNQLIQAFTDLRGIRV